MDKWFIFLLMFSNIALAGNKVKKYTLDFDECARLLSRVSAHKFQCVISDRSERAALQIKQDRKTLDTPHCEAVAYTLDNGYKIEITGHTHSKKPYFYEEEAKRCLNSWKSNSDENELNSLILIHETDGDNQ